MLKTRCLCGFLSSFGPFCAALLRRPAYGSTLPGMSHNPFHSAAAPDFRQMSADDLKLGIMTLAELSRDLKRFRRTGEPRHLRLWAEGTPGAARAAIVFPSAGIMQGFASMRVKIDQGAARMLVDQLVSEAETLRARYKDVWRARPGRAFRDIAARVKREKQRPRWTRWSGPK